MKNSKTIIWSCLATLLLMLVGSVVFYKERMYFLDPSWVTFKIINTNFFCFSEYRYGAFITQMFPLIGSFLQLPLKLILILYSASFYLFFTTAFILIVYYYKQVWLGVLMIFYLTLFVSDVYYWPNNEVHQGITWMLLFLANYLSSNGFKNSIYKNILGTVFLFFAIINHLLVSFPLAFLWCFIHLDNIKIHFKNKSFLYFSLLVIAFMILRLQLSQQGYYDSNKLEAINALHIDTFFKSFINVQSIWIFKSIFTKYILVIPAFIISIWVLWQSKKYYYIALYIISIIAYYGLVCVTYQVPVSKSNLFYMESEWMAFAVILATPAVYGFYHYKILKTPITILVLATIIVCGCRVYNSYFTFNNRFQKLSSQVNILRKKNIIKSMIINPDSLIEADYLMNWNLPVESVIYSAANDIKPNITFSMTASIENYTPKNTKDFYTTFRLEPYKNINSTYFNLDTIQSYSIINHSEFFD